MKNTTEIALIGVDFCEIGLRGTCSPFGNEELKRDSEIQKGLLATYNSLTDKHLAGYFNNTRIRRHLLRSGLITRSGRILSEKEYKVNAMKQDHQKHVRECLAQAIFHKALDMERYHQLEIKRKLDTLARKERIQRLKGEHTRRFTEDNMPILTPHPPAGPKTNRGCSILAEEGRSSPLTLTASRPYTAPGNMQPLIRLQPLLSNCATRNISKITSGSKPKTSLLESEAPFPIGGKKAMMKFRNCMDNSQRLDSYQLPDINSYHTPVPPTPLPQTGKIFRENRSEPWRRKRLRPITAPNGLEPLCTRDQGRIYKAAPHSNAVITMVYLGKNVHLSYDDKDFRDEIKIYQQHCGGENLCIYKGKLLEKDIFQFISKRHHGFPFSLTFFLNGIQVNRLSSCCEYKHRRSSRLGGKRGYFGFVSVEKASPCYRCIIAMGLDRKPSQTKPRKEKTSEKKEEQLKRSQGKLRKDRENASMRRGETEGRENSISATFSAEEIKSGVREVRTAIEEMEWKGKSEQEVWEEDQENTFKYDYEEDFEVDEESQDERAEDEDQVEDQMCGTSKSPTEGERDNSSPKKEIEISSEKALDVCGSESREDDVCLDSDEEDKQGRGRKRERERVERERRDSQDIKTVSSISSRSHPYSSESEEDFTDACVEAHSGNSAVGSSRSSSSQDLQENDTCGKLHIPVEESLETEIEEQEITKVDVDNGSQLTEVSCTHVAEEEPSEGTQEFAESEPKISWQSASPAAKAGGTIMVEEREEGVKEEVGQITDEAQPPGHYCSNTAAGPSTTEDEVTPKRKREVNVAGVVEERAAGSSNEQPEQAARGVCTLEKETAMAEDERSQPKDADTDAALREKTRKEEDEAHHPQDADMNVELREKVRRSVEVPLGKRNLTEEQPALAEQSTGKGERPPSTASEAEAGSEGHSRCGEEQLNPTGVSVSQRDVDPNRQTLLQTVVEKDRADSERGQVLEKAVLSSETLGESVVLKEAETPELEEVEREVGTPRPDGDQGKEGALTELEDTKPMEDTAQERENGFEAAILGGRKAATERRKVLEAEASLSSSAGEVGASAREDVQGNPEALWKEDTAREGVMADIESTLEQDPRVVLPGEFSASGDWEKVERHPTPLRETGSEREEVTGVKVLKTEEKLEEQKVKGEEKGTEKEVRSVEEAHASPNKMETDAEDRDPTRAIKLNENPRLLQDSPKERTITLFEAKLQFGKLLEENEATATEHKEELPGQEGEAPLQQGRAHSHDGTGLLGAPGPEPADKAGVPENVFTARSQEWAAKELDSLEGPELLNEEGPLEGQGRGIITHGSLPEERVTIAEVLSREPEREKPQEEGGEDRKYPSGSAADSVAGQNWAMGRGTDKDEEDPHGGRADEIAEDQREMLAESLSTYGDSMASSSADGQKETQNRADEVLGETAAEERVIVEDMGARTEKVAVVMEGTSAGPVETTQDQKAPEVQDSEGGEEKVSQ
ncbi:hypothetical protein H671_1g3211 [Cricetulus griseus]|uniref:DUF4590 domain-containing protein n=1 Tax=Cricetulus griseus TaxID=10029 RepID=A0A061II95_CRIGR|nr:hypothetical protein H671_1g3211 [Cricetulus griseus]